MEISLPFPIPNMVVEKSPEPSTDRHAALSNGDAKKAEAIWLR